MAIKRDYVHALCKKVFILLSVILLFYTSTISINTAHANVFAKPAVIAAKKAVKEIAKDTTQEMIEHMLFEMAINEFVNGDFFNLKEGHTPVCLDGSKTLADCPPDKLGQMKTDLNDSDNKKLSDTIETVIEEKTNTSTKWTKFLDWFIPIFIISGVVATIDTALDDDTESLIDEISRESLTRSGLLSSLVLTNSLVTKEIYLFDEYFNVANVTVDNTTQSNRSIYSLDVNLKPNTNLQFNLANKSYSLSNNFKINMQVPIRAKALSGQYYLYLQAPNLVTVNNTVTNSQVAGVEFFSDNSNVIYEDTSVYDNFDKLYQDGKNIFMNTFARDLLTTTDLNTRVSSLLALINLSNPTNLSFPTVRTSTEQEVPDISINPNDMTGIQNLKDSETDNYKIPGIGSFDFTTPEGEPVTPNPTDPSGNTWINTNTGEQVDPQVVPHINVTPKTETVPDTDTTTDLDQLGNNLPKELIFALLDMLRSILDYMVRLVTFVVSIPVIPATPIPNEFVMWFFNAKILGIHVMDLVRTLAITSLGMGVYRILKKVF